MPRFPFLVRAVVILAAVLCWRAALALDASVQQLIVSVAPTWDSQTGRLQLFEREGKGWKPIGAPLPVLYGRNGLAWGRGEFQVEDPARQKTERDKRAPAGIFKIGTIYTYDPALPEG